MAQPDRPHPVDDVWTAAVHTGDSSAPVGAAVVIDERRLLTCAHVVLTDGRVRAGLTVTFPKAVDAWGQRRAVAEVRLAAPTGVVDLAVLLLAEAVPDGVLAAPVRCPRPVDLVGRRWSAFGFPNGQPAGNGADGTVGLHLGHGLVRLDTSSRYVVEPGFSGGGLWSPEYEAVVGLVVRANERGDGQALTLFAADRYAPGERLRALAEWSLPAAGEVAIAAWGWALGTDPEGRRHWRPRARGVTVDSERGYRFRGRTSALSAIVHWLDRAEPDRQVLVVTGSPGVGKSAVLGRVVTTADAEIRASSPVDDPAVRATVGSVACAVHVKGKTALEVAGEVARAASAPLPEMLGDFAPALRDALAARGGTRFNVVVDALDESTSPAETREIISSVLLPLAQSCADVGAQVVVGTRRRDDAGDLLALLGPGARVVDLDAAEFFAAPDLAAYVQATLQLVGDERDDNPYAAAEVAVPVAARIAELAEGNFLVGGLVARAHGLFDPVPVPLEHVTFTSTVDAALDRYLERVPPLGRVPARLVLTVLAYAEAPGLPIELWQSGLAALGAEVGTEELSRFAHSSAANFLVESGTDRGATAFRLFHQALNDALLRGRAASAAPPDDRQRLVRAWLAYGRSTSWESAPGYLLRSLPSHALAAGLLDELLNDDSYLLHADLLRVLLVANNATTERGRARARMLRLTPEAQQGGPERAAMFSVTQELDHLAAGFTATAGAPYTSRWSASRVRHEYAVLEGHIGAVLAVCAVPVGDRALLASAGSDHTLRLWDPATGLVERLLEGHTHGVAGLSVVPVDGRVLLASAGHDGTVRLWDPESGLPERV
ncbi:MAG: trypsin-like peptidase domain-containing protein, partial [Micromonosporaceae bacterium]|nr:trypsin-like peptidase domain-containing protein [Micromonosporaceae bacterium]